MNNEAENATYECPLCKTKYKGLKATYGSEVTHNPIFYPFYNHFIEMVRCKKCIEKAKDKKLK